MENILHGGVCILTLIANRHLKQHPAELEPRLADIESPVAAGFPLELAA